jgi:hypothetical protein
MIYIGSAKAHKIGIHNKIEQMNEFLIQTTCIITTLFADFVPDQNMQFLIGWYMIAAVLLILFFNLFFVFRQVFNIVKSYIVKTVNFI